MMAAVAHVRALWGPWWLLPGGLPLAYAATIWAIGDLRPEHLIVPAIVILLAYATARTKQFFVDVLPYVLVVFAYDMVRYARAAVLTPDRVLGCGLRDAELALFGVAPGVTPQDWFQRHHAPFFDILFSVPYAIFAYLAIVYAAYLYFADRQRMRHYLWAFALANFFSFALWLIVPAAPPWYIRQYGCGIDLSVAPSPAALLRVDHYLGIDYFQTFYSRAASVFGAMPSMHCAYPLLGLLTAWKKIGYKTRPLHIAYALLMFGAAVYLDHHWILDAIAGWILAFLSVVIAGRILRRRRAAPVSLPA